MPTTSSVSGHVHTWKQGDSRTSVNDGHSHAVTKPGSGWTDRAGMNNHRHRLPSK